MSAPRASVVVPTYARPTRLRRCLAALARQDLPRSEFEVIVIDDGSPAHAAPSLDGAADGLEVTLVRQANAGPAAARNAGAACARGRLLAFTDDDCEPDPSWLRLLLDRHRAKPDVALGGSTRNALTANPFSEASQMLIDHLYAHYGADPGDARFLASNNLAFPTEAFRLLGGFSTDFPLPAGEDRELCDRWLHSGRVMHHVPEARIDHAHDLDLRGFWRQHFGYGRGAHAYRRARARRGRSVRIEPLRFYARLVTHPFHRVPPLRALGLAALLGLSQLANACGFAWEAMRSRRPMAPARSTVGP